TTNCTVFAEMLRHWDMRPTCVESGRAALATLTTAKRAGRPFKLAIIDMNMPQMDGLALASCLQEDPELHETRTVILTSAAMRGDAARCSRGGIDAYFLK